MHDDRSRQILTFLHPSFEGCDVFVGLYRRCPFALRIDEECDRICTVSQQDKQGKWRRNKVVNE